MTELKTLKDLIINPVNRLVFIREYPNKQTICKDEENKCVDYEELRQEAIKHIKMFESECNSEVDKSRPCAYCRGARDWFIKFFNITEEELK